MGETAIPVDLQNPGHIFAALGVAEVVRALGGSDVEIAFTSDGQFGRASAIVSTAKLEKPMVEAIAFFHRARVETILPCDDRGPVSNLSTENWGVASVKAAAYVSPSAVPPSPAPLPARVIAGDVAFDLSSWADGTTTGRDNVKFWAGAGGYPGSGIARDMLASIAEIPEAEIATIAADPFAYARPMTGGFRFDWRRDYIALDAGFSPNSHGDVKMTGYPLTELLAVAGLQFARPVRMKKGDKLNYRYAISSARLPLSFARVVLGAVDLGFPTRTFHMSLGWPGKENQARCILSAREEF